MKTDKIKEKFVEFFGKAGKKTLITIGAVFVISLAVVLNFLLFNGDGKIKDEGDIVAGADTEATDADETAGNDYFAAVALSRQQARDEAMEVLQSVVDSSDALNEVKEAAMDDITKIALEIETEANIETLIISKGFEQCVAVINDDKANIVVKSDGLTPDQVAQISEIVYEQSGILPVNIKITEQSG